MVRHLRVNERVSKRLFLLPYLDSLSLVCEVLVRTPVDPLAVVLSALIWVWPLRFCVDYVPARSSARSLNRNLLSSILWNRLSLNGFLTDVVVSYWQTILYKVPSILDPCSVDASNPVFIKFPYGSTRLLITPFSYFCRCHSTLVLGRS